MKQDNSPNQKLLSEHEKTCSDFALADTLVPNQPPQNSLSSEQILQRQNPLEVSPESTLNSSLSSMEHFKIIDILGKGGMGAVYKAKDLTLERFVAMKTLRINANAEPLILAEAKTISKLNHPNIVTVHDIARSDDANFIVMEWVDGNPLNRVIPPQGFSLIKTLGYAKQIIAALHCAHQHHIMHRDIKPQNIMVTSDDRIKVLDFGIALLTNPKLNQSEVDNAAREEHFQQIGKMTGSPQYMSPEQILGKLSDARSDLFSFGIVLYEMITGVKPFLGMNLAQISEAITQGRYKSLADVNSENLTKNKVEEQSKKARLKRSALPTELITLVDKLLCVEPSRRYQTAEDVANDLNIIDEKINQKNTWWQQQHGLTKALILLPVIALLAFSFRSILFPPTTQELIARQLVESKKIAFIPFDNISGDPVLQIFSDGITSMLSSDLAEVGYQQGNGNTWVIPTSELRKLENQTVADVYNKYGVDVIVTGSIQHMGSTRNLHLNLVNGRDGRQLKTTQLTISADDLFAAQTSIRQHVMDLLGWQIPDELSAIFEQKKPAFDGAYKHYLQGQGYLYRYDHSDNIDKALSAFKTAISIDSQYGDAYIGLAQAQLRKYLLSKDSTWLISMENTIGKLSSSNHDHVLLNYLHGELSLNKGQYEDAVKLFRQSVIKQPNFIKAYTGLSYAYVQLGKPESAEQALVTAYQLMPNIAVLNELGVFHFSNGDYAKAIEFFELLTQQAPNNYVAYLNISGCYYLSGNIEQAIAFIRQSLDIKPTADGYANLGTYYFILRDFSKAVASYEQMIALNDNDYVKWGNLADAYLFANNDKYVFAFEQAMILAKQALKLNPNNQYAIALMAYYSANLNKEDDVRFFANKIVENDLGENQFFIAAAYARINDRAAAIKYLEFAINNNYSITEISSSPLFDSLSNDVEFKKLMAKSL